jgi:hypothetical protein
MAEFPKEAPDGIDASRSATEIPGAETVQGVDGLLIDGFDGDGRDGLVASGFEEGLGIGPVGLVALAIAGHVSGGQQSHGVAEGLELPAPVVGGAAGFHEDAGRWLMQEEGTEASATEAMLLMDLTGSMRHGDLEDGLCEIDGHVRIVHEDSSPVFGLRGR